ncbi:EAL domain-containing protein [Pleomorphomonas sp. NRK KF1]|uniref:EAL domain-containing protein n=1 Tax=Pleomorphomonas sp. NRK KF1 TaxID=2943000 RepID=UPI002042E9BC|nr:EAL domain-containing protein [Pleomorphomonas sp. NRK KF1]MCM5554116.1 EAL domain-containing protein [Pleomorphomonas sp. NRK KF1]
MASRIDAAIVWAAARFGAVSRARLVELAIRAAMVAAVVIAAGLTGWLDRLDDRLTDLRFGAATRAPGSSLVLVDIDAKSLAAVGVWPWDRTIHARLVEQLEDLGARQIAFDIDFSARSNPASDKAFAKAIGAAEVPVFLAAFRQRLAAGDTDILLNRPIDMLAAEGWPALVNVPVDRDGRVRRFPSEMTVNGERLDALPALMAGAGAGQGPIAIDYSIDARALPHVSASDVLYGRVKPEAVAGKTALIGARALELHDMFLVPRWGMVAGAEVVALASETLTQGRNLARLPAPPLALPLMALALGLSLLPARRALMSLAALALLTEAAAVALQVSSALVLPTAMLHVAAAGLMAMVLFREYGLRCAMLTVARRETVNTRRFLERVIDDGFDGIVLIDERDGLTRINGEAMRLLGLGDATPKTVADLPAPLPAVVAAVRRPDGGRASAVDMVELGGRVLEYSVVAFPLEGGAFRQGVNRMCVSVALRDVTARQRVADRLRHMALHDELTGLANRAGLAELATGAGGALIYFDLDHFKAVNDSLGHKTGDQLLVEVARRAEARVGGAGILARMGGDEFAVYCPEGLDAAGELAAALLSDFATPFTVGGHRVTVGASFGVAGGDWDCRDLNILMRRADLALNAAQKQGRRRIAHFEAAMEAKLMRRLMLESELAAALDRGELHVAYQPQYDLRTGEVVSAEALMRWRHPSLGNVPPNVFIPIAEETGLIHQLTGWMMKRAALDAVAWARPIPVAVNVSVLDLKSGDVPAMAVAALEHSGLPASRFELEVTESAFVGADPTVSDAFDRLRARGIALALDDYGTGYASLGYLHRFPFTVLKIDKSFVDGVPCDPDAMAILQSVVVLARGLGLKTVAEGVELPEQRDALEQLGCDIGQGYLFSAPVSNSVLAKMLAKERAAVG